MNWPSITHSPIESKQVSIDLPASKSIANRLLVLRFIADIQFKISNLSEANDTKILNEILAQPALPETIDCQDAGTVFRFMTCLCAAQAGRSFVLKGTDHLLSRPMKPLIKCLTDLGADIELDTQSKQLIIQGKKLTSQVLQIPGNVSSQFISGLCLIAPLINGGLELHIQSPILSKPYINITLALMAQLGIKSTFDKNLIKIPEQKIESQDLTVEADWSSACFFYAFMILMDAPSPIILQGLQANDLQGDRAIAEICQSLGVKTTFTDEGALLSKVSPSNTQQSIDLGAYPDLAVPLLVASAFQFPALQFENLAHLKLKESNRIETISSNLENFGILLVEENGTISFQIKDSKKTENPIKISTFSDHRIAMSFALLAALGYSIELDNITCIDKSFPNFFTQISKVGFRLKNCII